MHFTAATLTFYNHRVWRERTSGEQERASLTLAQMKSASSFGMHNAEGVGGSVRARGSVRIMW